MSVGGRILAVSVGACTLLGLALPIYRWGRLLPIRWELVHQEDRNQDGRPDRWEYRSSSDPRERIVQLDEDGDGRAERTLIFGDSLRKEDFRQKRAPANKHLVVCLDGVPFELIEDLWRQGYFHEFHPPSKLISTFPSDSELALATVLKSPPVQGYENRYFDRRENRLRGGPAVTVRQAVSYHRLLDYDFPGWLRGPSFILPDRALRDDLARLHRAFLRTTASVFIAHLATTDSLIHVRPLEKVRPSLIEVDAVVREVLMTNPGGVDVTLFSDHGNTLCPSRRVPLERFLRANGYRLADRLGRERDVVVPQYGLIGAIAIYARPEDVPDLARRLVHLEGVDFTVRRDQEAIVVEGKNGRARILADRNRNAYRYEALDGDPLRLIPLWKRLAEEGKVENDGFVRERDLFPATLETRYPDALGRLFAAFTGPVKNPADVLVSLEDGYSFGAAAFDRIVRLQSTHGSLTARSSLGFIMTTAKPLPSAIPLDQALHYVAVLPRALLEPRPEERLHVTKKKIVGVGRMESRRHCRGLRRPNGWSRLQDRNPTH